MMLVTGPYQVVGLVFFILLLAMFVWRLLHFRGRRWYPVTCDVAHGTMALGMFYMFLPGQWQTISTGFPVTIYLSFAAMYLVCAPLIQLGVLHECRSCARRSYYDGSMALGMAYMFGMANFNVTAITYIFTAFFAYLVAEYTIRTLLLVQGPGHLVDTSSGKWFWNLQINRTSDPLARIGFHVCGVGMSVAMVYMFSGGSVLKVTFWIAFFALMAVGIRDLTAALAPKLRLDRRTS